MEDKSQRMGEPVAYTVREGSGEGRLVNRPYQNGDSLPSVGSYCLVSGANCDIESDQHRSYLWRQVLGYSNDKEFICLQTSGCWPTVERLTKCWFADIPHPMGSAPQPADPECGHCSGTGDVSGEYPGEACPECSGTGMAPQPAEPSRGEQRIEWLREVRECAEHVATSDYFGIDAAISKLMSVVERGPQPAEPAAKESLTTAEPVKVPSDQFNGDNAALVGNIHALLDLDAKGVLVPHGIGGHARTLLSAAASRLDAPAASEKPVMVPSDEDFEAIYKTVIREVLNVPDDRPIRIDPTIIYFGRSLLDRYCQPVQPAETVRLLCQKCGEKTSVSISNARLVTHFPNGMPRDARDIASDPEGKLIHEVDQDLAGYKKAPPISDVMMDLVDRLGSEYDKVELRAWEYLLVYAPKHMLTQPAARVEPIDYVAEAIGSVATVVVYEDFNGARRMSLVKYDTSLLGLGNHELYVGHVPAQPSVPEYTASIGHAGQAYLDSFKYAHPLPTQFRWADLWMVMCKAAARAQQGGTHGW